MEAFDRRDGREGEGSYESRQLEGNAAAFWLAERGLFDPKTQNSPQRILCMSLPKEAANRFFPGSRTVRLSSVASMLSLRAEDEELLHRGGTVDPVGILVYRSEDEGVDVVWAIEY
jgi:hypothetical protein